MDSFSSKTTGANRQEELKQDGYAEININKRGAEGLPNLLLELRGNNWEIFSRLSDLIFAI